MIYDNNIKMRADYDAQLDMLRTTSNDNRIELNTIKLELAEEKRERKLERIESAEIQAAQLKEIKSLRDRIESLEKNNVELEERALKAETKRAQMYLKVCLASECKKRKSLTLNDEC